MKRKTVYQGLFPLLTAFIWGSSFVTQSLAAGTIGAFAFNASRGMIASVELLIAVLLLRRMRPRVQSASEKKKSRHDLLLGGMICGAIFMVASNLQQYGIESNTSSGKAGFITALYIVIVPLLGLFFRKRVRPLIWISVVIALGGLYLLCFTPGASLAFSDGDFYVFLGSLFFSAHILAIDYFTQKVDGIELSCAQFIVMTLLSLVCALLFDRQTTLSDIAAGLPYILYVGVLSSGLGYTLQILAQREGDPTVVSLLLSTESLFAAVSGALILHERLAGREYSGCALMLCAVILAQLPERKRRVDLPDNV